MPSQVCVVYVRSCDVRLSYVIKPWVKLINLASFTFNINTEFSINRQKHKYQQTNKLYIQFLQMPIHVECTLQNEQVSQHRV